MVSSLADNYSDTFIPIFYNLNGDGYQPWCGTRAGFYGLQYVPRMWWGDEDGGSSPGAWEADIIARQALPTDVTMDITAFRNDADIDIQATVCVEFGGTSKNMRVYVVQVLDYFPASPTYQRNGFRQVATEDIWVEANSCVNVRPSMTLKAEDLAQLADVSIIAFAQEPLSGGPAEIYQATITHDIDGGVMGDGFQSGDLSGWDYN